MIKYCAFLTARSDMAREAFIRRYEEGHVPLITQLMPLFEDYRRSYLIKEGANNPDHLRAAISSIPFDVVTELWFADRARIEEMRRLVSETEAGRRIAEDERALFDRTRLRMCEVEERVTDASRLAPPPAGQQGLPLVKMLCFLSRRRGMSFEDFVEHYEERHVELALRLLRHQDRPLFAGYSRNYIRPQRSFAIGEPGANPLALDFDAMTTIRFWTVEDHQRFLAQCADPATAGPISEDEARFLDRDSIRLFLANEFGTHLGEQIK